MLFGLTPWHKKFFSPTNCYGASPTTNLIANRSSSEQNIFTQSTKVWIWGGECREAYCSSFIWMWTRVSNNGWRLFDWHKSRWLSRRRALFHCPKSFPQNQRRFLDQETWVDLWNSMFDRRKCAKGRSVRTSSTRGPFSWQHSRHVPRLLPNLKLLEFHNIRSPLFDLLKSQHVNSDSCKH